MNAAGCLARRRFLKHAAGVTAGAVAFPYVVPSSALGKAGTIAPSNRIVMGAIGVVELREPVDMRWIQPRLVELGVWLRPFGKLLYVMPPFVINTSDLSRLTTAMNTVVREIEAASHG